MTTNLFTPSTLLIALPERTTDAEVREGSSMRTIVLLLLVVGVIGMLALVNNNQKQQAAPAPQASAPVQRSLENVDLKVSWRKTSTNMMIATIAVTNRNDHDVKDLDVECTMYSQAVPPLGKHGERSTTSYPPRQTAPSAISTWALSTAKRIRRAAT